MEDWEQVAKRAKRSVKKKLEYCERLASELGNSDAERRKISLKCLEEVQRYGRPLMVLGSSKDPLVEGVSFENKALIDSMPLDCTKITKRLREYCKGLDEDGQLIVTTQVVGELQEHGIIRPISKIKGYLRDISEDINRKIKHSEVRDQIKEDIVNVINAEIEQPCISKENIVIKPSFKEYIKDLGETLEDPEIRKAFKKDFSYADKSIITVASSERFPLIITADRSYETQFDALKDLISPDLKLITQRQLGIPPSKKDGEEE